MHIPGTVKLFSFCSFALSYLWISQIFTITTIWLFKATLLSIHSATTICWQPSKFDTILVFYT